MTKKEVKTISLIGENAKTSNSYGRNMPYRRYRVLVNGITPLENVFEKEELKSLAYWSSRSTKMAMTCWGTSQYFEAQLALSSWLGWKIEGEEWSDYTFRITKLITEL